MAQINPPALPTELQSAIDAHTNRKRYSEIDLNVLGRIADENLDQAIIDYINLRFDKQPDQRKRVLAKLPSGFRVFYATWLIEAEVMNGGFNQYFWNSSSEFAEVTPEALKTIGDPIAADLMSRALKTALDELPTITKFKKLGTLQAFSDSYKHTKLTEFDSAFAKRAEAFPALRVKYIRANPQLFTTD
jgi:hypothetical protein